MKTVIAALLLLWLFLIAHNLEASTDQHVVLLENARLNIPVDWYFYFDPSLTSYDCTEDTLFIYDWLGETIE